MIQRRLHGHMGDAWAGLEVAAGKDASHRRWDHATGDPDDENPDDSVCDRDGNRRTTVEMLGGHLDQQGSHWGEVGKGVGAVYHSGTGCSSPSEEGSTRRLGCWRCPPYCVDQIRATFDEHAEH